MGRSRTRRMGRLPEGAAEAQAGRAWPGWPWLLLALSAAALCLPMLAAGPLQRGSDVFSTMHYLREFMTAFGQGDLYPRWTGGTNRGLGAPTFVMFPPLFFYAAGCASWLTGSLITGVKLYLVVLSLLTAGAVYVLAREWIGPGLPAAVAAALYLLLPYRVMDMYQRFAMSETTAFLFLPLILLFARRTLERPAALGFAGLALSYAALVYTHIVTAYTFSLVLGAWLLWQGWGRWRSLVAPGLALALGLALASPALLPAVFERVHANIEWVREMPNGDFRINFIFRDDLLPGLGIKDPVKPLVLRSAISQLLLAAAAGGLALLGLRGSERRLRGDAIFLLALAGVAYFLQLEISTALWQIVPELPTIQFPWRLQTYMVLAAALLVGCAAWGPPRAPSARAAALGLLGLLVALNLAFSWGNARAKPFDFTEEALERPGVHDWIEPSGTPVQFEGYRRFRFERTPMPETGFASGRGSVDVERWESSRRLLRVESESGGEVWVRTFWFPGWTGRMNGEPLDLAAARRTGVISFQVPPGRHQVELEFGATPLRRASAWIGGLALLGVAAGSLLVARLTGLPAPS